MYVKRSTGLRVDETLDAGVINVAELVEGLLTAG